MGSQIVTLNGVNYSAILNSNLRDSRGEIKLASDHFVDYVKTSDGAYRFLQILTRITQLAVETLKSFGSRFTEYAKDLVHQFTFVPLIFAYLPDVTQRGYCSLIGLCTKSEEDSSRETIQQVHDIADGAASWCYAGMLLTLGNTLLKNLGDSFNLIADVSDLEMATKDWLLAQDGFEKIQLQESINKDVQQRFAETKQYALLRIAKATSCVASGVIGLCVVALGGPVFPAVVMISISLFATTMGMVSHFFKATSTYEVIDFFKKNNLKVSS